MNNYSNSNSIFLKKDHGADTIDGKITLTNIMETIPPNSSESPNEESIKSGKTEIRWRILEFYNDVRVVEISRMKPKYKGKRKYFTKKGIWRFGEVSAVYDDYVVKQFYYYP